MTIIRAVETKKDLKDFINVPKVIYKDDPNFIAQLDYERLAHFSPKNPFFEHATVQFWVAYDEDNTLIGRVSAQMNELAPDGEGHFGCIEANTHETLKDLMVEAEKWLKDQGTRTVMGPYALSINDEVGLLVDGYDDPPQMMMNYAPRWYAQSLEGLGYTKAKDVVAMYKSIKDPIPPALTRMTRKFLNNDSVVERQFDMSKYREDLDIILDIFNDAWSTNWGFIPMTPNEVTYMANSLKPILNPKFARICWVDNKPAAMIVALPDLNEIISGFNGKLFPFNWLKLLWRLKVKKTKRVRVVLMGVSKTFQGTSMSGALAAYVITKVHEAFENDGKVEDIEMSWMLEDNTNMIRIIQATKGYVYKTYRVYQKNL